MDTPNAAAGADLLAPVQSNQAAARGEPQSEAPRQVPPAEAEANREAKAGAEAAEKAAAAKAKAKTAGGKAAKAAEVHAARKGFVYGRLKTSQISDPRSGKPLVRGRIVHLPAKRAEDLHAA